MKQILFRLVISLITLTILEPCSLFGIETYNSENSTEEILWKGILYSMKTEHNKELIFPIEYEGEAVSYRNPPIIQRYIANYQPTIRFLTKGRFEFEISVGCTICGEISKINYNTFDITKVEDSINCEPQLFRDFELQVYNTCKLANTCVVEKERILFKKDNEVIMVFNVIN